MGRFFQVPSPYPLPRLYFFERGGLRWRGRGRLFYTSHFKGGCCPLCIPHGGEVSPAGSVGVGKAPLALNASPAPPPTRRMSLSCREFRERETRPSKLHKVQLDSFAHPPRACLVRVRCLNLCSLEAGLASPYGGRYVPVARCLAADRAGRRDGVTPVA